jgi:hypothetical protein
MTGTQKAQKIIDLILLETLCVQISQPLVYSINEADQPGCALACKKEIQRPFSSFPLVCCRKGVTWNESIPKGFVFE